LEEREVSMLQVSERAGVLLKETLLNERQEDNQVLRLHQRDNQIALGLGVADETDVLFEHDGTLILAAPADLANELEDVIIELEDLPDGPRLVLMR